MATYFQGFGDQTNLSAAGLSAVLILGSALLAVPRRYAILPMLAMACTIPPGQRVIVGGLNFDLLRIMVLFGTARLLIRAEWRDFRWVTLDYVVVAYCAFALFATIVLYFDFGEIKYKMGIVYDIIGMYMLFRCLIKDWKSVDTITTGFAVLAIPVAAAFVLEWSTGRNPFAAMGGVPEFTDIREGRLRCQGAFAHSILAGCFWACALPMIVAQWWRRSTPKWLILAGSASCLLIIILCSSSTPVSAIILAIPAALLFYLRRHMSAVRWTIVALAIVLQLMMNNPIWFLLAKVNIVGGSTGWFRYNLMQQAVNHIDEWWLIGSDLGTTHWGWGLWDVVNFYIVQGLHGGLLLLALFIGMMALAWRHLGAIVHRHEGDRGRAAVAWALGVAIFLHASNFLAVSYFGQINLIFYLQLAMAASLMAAPLPMRASRRTPSRRAKVVVATVPSTDPDSLSPRQGAQAIIPRKS